MPRTKKRNIKESSSRYLQTIREFRRLVKLKIQQVQYKFKQLQKNFLRSFHLALDRFPLEIQNLTLHEILACESLNREDLSSKILKNPKISKNGKANITAVSNDRYESQSMESEDSTMYKRRLRSAMQKKTNREDLSSKNLKNSKISKNGKTNIVAVSNDRYESQLMESEDSTMYKRRLRSAMQKKTKARSQIILKDRKLKLKLNNNNSTDINQNLLKSPLYKSTNTFTITPKIKQNSTANILRKPKDGDTTTLNDRISNINVPLKNGNILSLLPCNETSLTNDLHVDEETKDQLKILHSHLQTVLK